MLTLSVSSEQHRRTNNTLILSLSKDEGIWSRT